MESITEIKETLTGTRKVFDCRVLARRAGEVVVLFISTTDITVDDLTLPAGTVTFGYFWSDRPYNVYHWMTPSGRTIALYVNLADQTRLDETTLFWRDLAVDVLIDPAGAVRVLDEHELPASLDAATRTRVEAAKQEVLARAPLLRAELSAASAALWPQVFGGPS